MAGISEGMRLCTKKGTRFLCMGVKHEVLLVVVGEVGRSAGEEGQNNSAADDSKGARQSDSATGTTVG
jgi:hypothetical protein